MSIHTHFFDARAPQSEIGGAGKQEPTSRSCDIMFDLKFFEKKRTLEFAGQIGQTTYKSAKTASFCSLKLETSWEMRRK